jgi:hypothetical protein
MEIGVWLRELGLGQCEQAFRDNDVDFDLLTRLTAEELKEIGVATVGHRRRLLDAIAGLRAEAKHRQGARSFELRAATSLARLGRDRGKCGEARDILRPIYGWFSEGFDTPDLEDAKDALEALN